MGKVPAPKWGAGTSPIFFKIQNIKFGWSKDAFSMEYIRSVHRGHLQGGGQREKCVSDGVLDRASTEC